MSNSLSNAHMSEPSRLGRRVGDRWIFALEFDIQGDLPRAWNEMLGSLWLWTRGHLVGTPYEIETIKTGLDSLQEAATEDREPASRILSKCNGREALEKVMWARYGEDHDLPPGMAAVDKEALFSLEVLPRRTGPFFDGWEAILVEDGAGERFIYRHEETAVVEAVWPKGMFRRVIDQAITEFEGLAQSISKGTNAVM